MKRIARAAASVSICVATFVALAANDPKQLEDLTSVIALHGKACGEVVSYVAQGDNDFLATCKDGNHYRVYVKDGRVVVEKK